MKNVEHLDAALNHVRQFRRAVDVGAHTGTWTLPMARLFEAVEAFEPVPRYHGKWRGRMEKLPHATLHPVALGAVAGTARQGQGEGKPWLLPSTDGGFIVRTLDSFGWSDVDLLKIDVEGADALVIRGALKTIEQCRPVIVVEEIPEFQARFGLPKDAVRRLMERLGARLVADLPPNLIYVFEEAR